MDRVWKTISLTPYYEVSNDGKVRNKITGGYRFEEVSL